MYQWCSLAVKGFGRKVFPSAKGLHLVEGTCDWKQEQTSLRPILLQRGADQTSVDFTRGRFLPAISKPLTHFFADHNYSWLMKTLLGEDNYSSTLSTPIRLESMQLSRVISTRTLTQIYCDVQSLSKFWLLNFSQWILNSNLSSGVLNQYSQNLKRSSQWKTLERGVYL